MNSINPVNAPVKGKTPEKRPKKKRGRSDKRPRKRRKMEDVVKDPPCLGSVNKGDSEGNSRKRVFITPVGGSVSMVASGQNSKETPTEVKIASWNVTSISHKVCEVNSAGGIDMERSKQVVRILYLMQKMQKEGLYLMCLQETRLEDKVFRYKSGYVLVNHNTKRTGHNGVEILLSPNVYKAWNRAKRKRSVDGNGRAIFVELATQTQGVRWVVGSHYSPRSKFPGDVRLFYSKAGAILENIHGADHVTLCGDYNGAVGRSQRNSMLLQKEVVGFKNSHLQPVCVIK